ncbi:Fic/DOC family protein [Nocardia asteroides]|uniref:Fic/DOC family protein n=1 Tax=Nocardia asteroides TaxID=1824 RepID=UPI001E589FA0|nr:Fic family protein [Nocardia asteroides]UGT58861.1 Fic family protein [Nocardia asteroides]
MSPNSPEWQAYLWPSDTDPGAVVLRNKFGTRDPEELRDLEYVETAMRQAELESGEVQIARTGDGAEWRAIHHHLFQDVYDWAGQYRTVDLNKTGEPFLAARAMDPYLHSSLTQVRQVDWSSLDREQFVDAAAHAYMQLNFAHPFREGNGRSSRLFLDSLTADARFTLDYSRVDADRWNEASRATMNAVYQLPADHTPLVAVFDAITVDRDPHPGAEAEPDAQLAADIARVQKALRAQSPRPARAVLRPGRNTTAAAAAGEVAPAMPEHDTGYER